MLRGGFDPDPGDPGGAGQPIGDLLGDRVGTQPVDQGHPDTLAPQVAAVDPDQGNPRQQRRGTQQNPYVSPLDPVDDRLAAVEVVPRESLGDVLPTLDEREHAHHEEGDDHHGGGGSGRHSAVAGPAADRHGQEPVEEGIDEQMEGVGAHLHAAERHVQDGCHQVGGAPQHQGSQGGEQHHGSRLGDHHVGAALGVAQQQTDGSVAFFARHRRRTHREGQGRQRHRTVEAVQHPDGETGGIRPVRDPHDRAERLRQLGVDGQIEVAVDGHRHQQEQGQATGGDGHRLPAVPGGLGEDGGQHQAVTSSSR